MDKVYTCTFTARYSFEPFLTAVVITRVVKDMVTRL